MYHHQFLFRNCIRQSLKTSFRSPNSGFGARERSIRTSCRKNSTMASMKTANCLKVVMDEGTAAFGCWQMAPGSNISRTLARTGVDFVVVDCERKSTRPVLQANPQKYRVCGKVLR